LTAKFAIALSEGDRKATPLEYRFPSYLERDRALRVPLSPRSFIRPKTPDLQIAGSRFEVSQNSKLDNLSGKSVRQNSIEFRADIFLEISILWEGENNFFERRC
jgi:hypothetical protein